MFGEKKCFTSANDNDYYCHAFRGWPHTKVKRVPMNARHCSHCFQYYLASRVLAFFSFLFRAVDALAACAHPNHILMYAHRDSLSCRLPTTRTISEKLLSYFALWMRWLRALTRITYLCMLIGFTFLPPSHNTNYFEKKHIFSLFQILLMPSTNPLDLIICICSYFLNRGVKFLRFLILSR